MHSFVTTSKQIVLGFIYMFCLMILGLVIYHIDHGMSPKRSVIWVDLMGLTMLIDLGIIWPLLVLAVYGRLEKENVSYFEYMLFFRGFSNFDPRGLVTFSF